MNRLLLLLFSLFIMARLSAQQINQEIKMKNKQAFLIGQVDVKGLSSNSYQNWYKPNHNTYQVNTKIILPLSKKLAEHKILLFLGTWCGDSKRETPRFIKILETASFPMENLKIIAVDKRKEQYKKSPTGEEWGLQITRVPTIIFYKNGREINRIIESPAATLEEDIKSILLKTDYTPNYPKSLHFD